MASLQELLGRFKSVDKPASSLVDEAIPLPEGKSTGEVVRKLFDSRQSSASPEYKSTSSENMVAVCLVIVDSLLHEEVWKAWLDTGCLDASLPTYSGRLFIHAKYPERIKSAWVRARTLNHTFHPEWNSPEVVRAMLSTLEAAVQPREGEPRCGRIVFGTESCAPIYSLQEAGARLFRHSNRSWLSVYNVPKNRYEAAHCFQAVNKDLIPNKAVWKALPGWIMLTRSHGEEIMALLRRLGGWGKGARLACDNHEEALPLSSEVDLVDAFGPSGQWNADKGGVHAPEEVFFATMLSILGYLRESRPDEVIRQSVTHAEWLRNCDANPVAFPSLTAEIVARIRSSTRAVFARKFPRSISVELWRSLVLPRAAAPSKRVLEEEQFGEELIGEAKRAREC